MREHLVHNPVEHVRNFVLRHAMSFLYVMPAPGVAFTKLSSRASVRRFIENSRHRRHRCVCIVHGRGLHSEGNASVLKARVRECLRLQSSVLAFADAPPSDGGAGAVYVLLRT